MFRKNDQHLQMTMFSGVDSLPEKQLKRLEASWAGVFYREFFVRIDEEVFAVLYSAAPSRPNIPVNVLAGLETLKAGFGWSDEELYDAFLYNVQVRYALGYRNLGEGQFELRTVYNFRHRLSEHMQKTGQNLLDQAFEQVTDQQIAALGIKTTKLRMDSSQIASNIREMSRLQLLVEVLQRVYRLLSSDDQARYAEDFAPYVKGSSGQYIYRIKPGETDAHLQAIGELMSQLLVDLADTYAAEPTFQMLKRVFSEHFVLEDSSLRAKQGQELSATSLQSPDDQEATYRKKRGHGYKGYVVNVTETCDPENDLQLIVDVQTAPNATDDAELLDEALPELVERTDADELYTDGGYNSPAVDASMQQHGIKQVQTAIRGGKPAGDRFGLADFDIFPADGGVPTSLTCPRGQTAVIKPGRQANRFLAYFTGEQCAGCPFAGGSCPTKPLKRKRQRVFRFSQRQADVARRRRRSAQTSAHGQNLRSAVESAVRSVKHPFRHGKLPVRGRFRVSMLMIGSAAMTNIRRIHRYLAGQNEPHAGKEALETGQVLASRSAQSLVPEFLGRLCDSFARTCCQCFANRSPVALAT
jgi:hypothetical protein